MFLFFVRCVDVLDGLVMALFHVVWKTSLMRLHYASQKHVETLKGLQQPLPPQLLAISVRVACVVKTTVPQKLASELSLCKFYQQ